MYIYSYTIIDTWQKGDFKFEILFLKRDSARGVKE